MIHTRRLDSRFLKAVIAEKKNARTWKRCSLKNSTLEIFTPSRTMNLELRLIIGTRCYASKILARPDLALEKQHGIIIVRTDAYAYLRACHFLSEHSLQEWLHWFRITRGEEAFSFFFPFERVRLHTLIPVDIKKISPLSGQSILVTRSSEQSASSDLQLFQHFYINNVRVNNKEGEVYSIIFTLSSFNSSYFLDII